jgi:hypothetical protein
VLFLCDNVNLNQNEENINADSFMMIHNVGEQIESGIINEQGNTSFG